MFEYQYENITAFIIHALLDRLSYSSVNERGEDKSKDLGLRNGGLDLGSGFEDVVLGFCKLQGRRGGGGVLNF